MRKPYVLAIEHNWRLRKLLKANLEALGIQVREAVSEQHGRQCLDEGRPELILLDLDLPGGLELLWETRRRYAAQPVPIVLLSAEPPARHLLHGAPVTAHLVKPFGVPSLLKEIQGLLGTLPRDT